MAIEAENLAISADAVPDTSAVQLVPLRALPVDTELCSVLGPLERARLARMSRSARRRQFLGGHWLARRMACEHFGGVPGNREWRTSLLGAPSLCDGRRAVYVSIAHSEDLLACAVSTRPIGIDIEVSMKRRQWSDLAESAFPCEVPSDWRLLPIREQRSRFLTWWSLHEARAKRDGIGIDLRPLRERRVLSCVAPAAEAITWTIPRGVVAVAGSSLATVRGAPGHRSWWRFECDGA